MHALVITCGLFMSSHVGCYVLFFLNATCKGWLENILVIYYMLYELLMHHVKCLKWIRVIYIYVISLIIATCKEIFSVCIKLTSLLLSIINFLIIPCTE